MKYSIILFLFLFLFIQENQAQKRAITQEGRVILLHENGTWEYLKLAEKETEIQVIDSEAEHALTDNSFTNLPENYVSEWVELLHEESPILSKYFKQQNKILCKVQLVISKGITKLNTIWKMNTKEGFRYYGYMSPQHPLTIRLKNKQEVSLKVKKKIYPVDAENHPISTYTASYEVSPAELVRLGSYTAETVEITWKRRKTENYKIIDSRVFISLLHYAIPKSK